jgi:hypothetical protein
LPPCGKKWENLCKSTKFVKKVLRAQERANGGTGCKKPGKNSIMEPGLGSFPAHFLRSRKIFDPSKQEDAGRAAAVDEPVESCYNLNSLAQ